MSYFISIYGAVVLLSLTDFSKKFCNLGIWFSIILLSMLAGLRTIGGIDFEVYQNIYYGFGIAYFSDEYGYIWLNKLFSSLGFSYNFFLFIYTFISVYLLVIFLHKHTKFPSFALLFYMACYFFFYNMVLNRQMLCMSLTLWAIYEWKFNKCYSLFIIIIGMMFHNSIFVLIPFLLIFELLNKSLGCKKWIIFFSIFVALALLFSPEEMVAFITALPGLSFIGKRLANYLMKAEVSTYTLNSIEYIKMALAILMILPFLKKLIKDKANHIWLFMYFVGVVLLIWTRNIEILFRIFVYFDLSLLVLLPLCLGLFLQRFSCEQKQIVALFAYGFMGALSLASVLYRAAHFDNGLFLQYHFYFLS